MSSRYHWKQDWIDGGLLGAGGARGWGPFDMGPSGHGCLSVARVYDRRDETIYETLSCNWWQASMMRVECMCRWRFRRKINGRCIVWMICFIALVACD